MRKHLPNEIQDKIIRKKQTWERLKIAFELNELARELIRIHIRSTNPEINQAELEKIIADRFLK